MTLDLSEAFSEAFVAAVELCEAKGGDAKGKVWSYSFGEWAVKLNGLPTKEDGVPGFHCLIERHGLPAMLLSPFGGEAIGEAEKDFIDAAKEEVGP